MIKHVKLFAPFLMFVFYTSFGQSQTNLPQDNISKGLYSESQVKEAATSKVPMSMVRNVKQARNGDILIASYLGVFRYNARLPDRQGKSFTNLTSKIISPRFSSFWDVLEDRKGNLWFATKDSGVYYYPSTALRAGGKSLSARQADFQHFTTKNGLASNQALHIYEDRAGNIWFGSSRYDGKSLPTGQAGFRNFKMKEAPSITPADSMHSSVYQHPLPEVSWMHNDVNSIIEDKTGKLWFGTRGYAFVYDARLPDGQGKTFTTITNKDGKPFANVRSMIKDKKGNIWLGGYDGLWRYDGKTFTNFTRNFVGYIYEDKKGNIWFGTLDGVYRYDGKTITEFKGAAGQK